MAAPRLTLTANERAAVGKIVTRFPGLASAVHAQVTRLIEDLVPTPDGALTRPAQVDDLLLKIVEQVVARTKNRRKGAARGPDVSVDTMVLLLARSSVARARPRLLEGLTATPDRKKGEAGSALLASPPPAERVRVRGTRRSH